VKGERFRGGGKKEPGRGGGINRGAAELLFKGACAREPMGYDYFSLIRKKRNKKPRIKTQIKSGRMDFSSEGGD